MRPITVSPEAFRRASKTGLRAVAVVGGVVFAISAFTGCTTNLGGTAANNGMTHDSMMHNGSMNMGTQADNAAFSSADIMFAQMMMPHHQQAVDMGTLAETRASNPAVKALAAKIKAEQGPEIAQMKAWLETAGASMNMGYNMAMNGMLDSAAMTALTGATGAAFDKLYLEGMIGHHTGAVDMAKSVLNSKNAEVNRLANAIVASQTEQINYMQGLLKN